MTIQQLLVFYSLSKTLNYSHSAEELFMSRQAVRQNIASLEKELGGTLIVQVHNHLSLSEKGKLLEKECRPLIEAWNHLEKTMFTDIHPSHPIRLAVSDSVIPDFLSNMDHALSHFEKDFPNLKLKVIHCMNDDAAEMAVNEKVDLSIIMHFGSVRKGLLHSDILSFPLCLLVSENCDLFEKDYVDWKSLDHQHVLIPGKGDETEMLCNMIKDSGAKPYYEIVPNYYQVYYAVREKGAVGVSRYVPQENSAPDQVHMIPAGNVRICASVVTSALHPCAVYEPFRQYLFSYYQTYFAGYMKSFG